MANPILALLSTRRSVQPDKLVSPGPTPAELETILTIGARVPDHKKLTPWRFIVFQGNARARFGETIAQACVEEEKEPPSRVRLEKERKRLMRAPTVVAAISHVVERRGVPEWEQILSAGAACFNICLAANAMGYGTSWITEWIAYNSHVRAALGLAHNERLAGFIYIGTPIEQSSQRARPELSDIVTYWQD